MELFRKLFKRKSNYENIIKEVYNKTRLKRFMYLFIGCLIVALAFNVFFFQYEWKFPWKYCNIILFICLWKCYNISVCVKRCVRIISRMITNKMRQRIWYDGKKDFSTWIWNFPEIYPAKKVVGSLLAYHHS